MDLVNWKLLVDLAVGDNFLKMYFLTIINMNTHWDDENGGNERHKNYFKVTTI